MPQAPYPCCACVHTHRSGYRQIVQCDGTMRLILGVPNEGSVVEFLECDKCGRTAQPEDDAAE